MPVKEWAAVGKGRSICVVNTWTGGTTLYIDGECSGRNTRFCGHAGALAPCAIDAGRSGGVAWCKGL